MRVHMEISHPCRNSKSLLGRLLKFTCGFQFISKWQGTASRWQGLGPARPTLGHATDINSIYVWKSVFLNYFFLLAGHAGTRDWHDICIWL